jgi:hypothetical protein
MFVVAIGFAQMAEYSLASRTAAASARGPNAKNRAQRIARPIVFIVHESPAAGGAAGEHLRGEPSGWSRVLRKELRFLLADAPLLGVARKA